MKLAMISDRYRADLKRAKSSGLMRSAIGGRWVAYQLASLRAKRAELQNELVDLQSGSLRAPKKAFDAEVHGSAFDHRESSVMALAVRAWVECSISLNAICTVRGIAYVHALQPTLFDAGAKPMAGKEAKLAISEGWRRGVQLGYSAMRAAIPELEAAGVHFLDLSMAFAKVDEVLYFDACHFGGKGSKMLVDDVARAVLSTLK